MSDLDPPPEPWRHGRWTAEIRGDELADLAFDDVRLLRAVRAVLRDRDWNTAAVTARCRPVDAGFGLSLDFGADLPYRADLTVEFGDHDALITFDGWAVGDLTVNRVGLVLLHPMGDAGRSVTVHHTDGHRVHDRWPVAISPHQPFRDVAGFRWERDGVEVNVTLRGEVFETEDQRNWTDASFKTYGTPLDRPFPVAVAADTRHRQQVRVTARGRGRPPTTPPGTIVIGGPVGTLPALGLGAALHPAPVVVATAPSVATVSVELLPGLDVTAALAAAVVQADALGAGLDVRIVAADPGELETILARLVGARPTRLARLAAYDPVSHLTTPALWQSLTSGAARHRIDADLVGGTRAHFTELNRGRQHLPVELPAWTFSLTPQMHAIETPHLLDSLAAQAVVARDVVALAAGRPVHVGPITLRRRFNAVATTALPTPEAMADDAVDPRQHSDLTAAWTLASVAALSIDGISSLSYFETAGPRGVGTTAGPDPTGAVLATLAPHAGRPVHAVTAPTGVAALALRPNPGEIELHTANLGPDPRTLPIAEHPAEWVRLGPWSVDRRRLRVR